MHSIRDGGKRGNFHFVPHFSKALTWFQRTWNEAHESYKLYDISVIFYPNSLNPIHFHYIEKRAGTFFHISHFVFHRRNKSHRFGWT